jgi:HK97 family phage major capsid protein
VNLAELRARLEAIEAERREIHTAAGDGELNEEQQTRWDGLDTEETQLRADIATAEAAEARAARVAASRARFGAQFSPTRDEDPTDGVDLASSLRMNPGELRSRALRVLDDGRENVRHLDMLNPAQFGSGDVREKVERLIGTRTANFRGDHFARMLLLTESPAYRSAFQKVLGGAAYFTPEEGRALDAVREARTALNITTDASGGFAVPILIDPTVIWTGQGHPNDFFQIARVENITTDEWKGVTSAGATAYWTTEGVAATDGAPTIAQPVVTTKKLTVYIPYSVEVGGDWPGFASEMAEAIDMVWNEELVSKFTNGLGTTAQPTGFVTALEAVVGSQVASDDSGSATAADVYRMWAALPIKYRRTARWMANTAIENAIRQAGTTDPNFTVNLLSDGLPSLFARPFHENDYMDGVVASTSDSTPLALGDWRNFLIANRVGLTVENIAHVIDTTTGTPTGQRALYAWGRVGSNVINAAGFRILSQT